MRIVEHVHLLAEDSSVRSWIWWLRLPAVHPDVSARYGMQLVEAKQ